MFVVAGWVWFNQPAATPPPTPESQFEHNQNEKVYCDHIIASWHEDEIELNESDIIH